MVLKYKGCVKRIETIEDALSTPDGRMMTPIGSKSACCFIARFEANREDT